jgi:membrane peptidoglycan carboxypeptidase
MLPTGPSTATSRVRRLAARLGVLLAVTLAIVLAWELHASILQARYLSRLSEGFQVSVQPGQSPSIRFPENGAVDRRLGYTRIPEFVERLAADGFVVESQARQSESLAAFIGRGHFPPHEEKGRAGMQVLDCASHNLQSLSHPHHAYASYEAVPPLVLRTLLFIEDRELLAPSPSTRNPALAPVRVARDLIDDTLATLDASFPGASRGPLALRTERQRHAPEGRDASWPERWRLFVSASVRAYRDGPDTSAARRRIVLDHLNGMPLGELPHGGVLGLGDGLAAWYGTDFDTVNRALHEDAPPGPTLRERARAYRQVLSLLIAQRRPAYYLAGGQGRMATLVDRYLHLLAREKVIDESLRDAALDAWEPVRDPQAGDPPALRTDAAHLLTTAAARAEAATLLPLPSASALDRLDVSITSTLDGRLQPAVSSWLMRLRDPAAARAAGLVGDGLLERGELKGIDWSITLVERGSDGVGRVRVQVDTGAVPPALEARRADLGATAKLRTLASYLEAVAALHARLNALDPAALAHLDVHPGDPLSRWAVEHLSATQDRSLAAMLDAAMQRRYSASPAETFYTGGGMQRFHNVRPEDDERTPSIAEALHDSVNLVFVRLMRDLVHHHVMRGAGGTRVLAGDPARASMTPARHEAGTALSGLSAGPGRWRGRAAALESDAFAEILRTWRRTGYPYDSLLPSYASAIGGAGDRPDALADLLGIIVNDGRRQPTTHIEALQFATGTPYETTLRRAPAPGEQVMTPEVAATLKHVLAGVVEHGSAQRLRGAFDAQPAGGQAGVGSDATLPDAPEAGGQVATFAFFIGDRHHGIITARVPENAPSEVRFGSALPVQLLRGLAPLLQGTLQEPATACPTAAAPSAVPKALRVETTPSPARATPSAPFTT